MRLRTVRWIFSLCFVACTAMAQMQIGGGTCGSSSLSGDYAVSITGRQVTAAGAFTNIFQATGIANFDGQNKITFNGASNTLQSVGSPVTWSGTYSMQADCSGQATITTGGNATLNLVAFNQGGDNLLLTGSDATYNYNGNGNRLATACSTKLLSGSYAFNGTGFSFSGGAINGVENATGLLQFDGQGKATAQFNVWSGVGASAPTALAGSGSYSVSSNCLGTAMLTDTKGNSTSLGLSITGGNLTATTDLMVTVGQPSKLTIDGAAHTVTADACSAASLNGTYSLSLSGRALTPTGSLNGTYQGTGIITFDGQGNLTITGTSNTNQEFGKQFTSTGTYTVASSCGGTANVTKTNETANFSLVVWSMGKQFNLIGSDSKYIYSGGGTNTRPPGCNNATLSGEYTYDAVGNVLSGSAEVGVAGEIGVLQFDGQGNVTAKYVTTSAAGPVTSTATGTYSVGSNCAGSATLTDSSAKPTTLNFSILSNHGQTFDVIEANPQFVRSGAAHSAMQNPTQSIGNVASYAVDFTPPGSVFVLFGESLSSRPFQATNTPLPGTLGSTSVTVNGETAPLFYVDANQIDAQMPWDIPPGSLATVIVKNGSTVSNAAAVWVPATGPGISVYSNNRAVVVNPNGSVNSPTAAAAVGDQVVAYFTGGGAVQAGGKLVTGAPAPPGLSPVSGNATVTVGTANAIVKYIGLTPGSIGLYQVNFIVPQLPKGAYPVVITIDGVASNAPLMTISD